MSTSLPAIGTSKSVCQHQSKMAALPSSTTVTNGGSESPKPPLCWSSACLAGAAARSADCLLMERRRRRRTQMAQRNGCGCNGENPKDVPVPDRPQDVTSLNHVDEAYSVNESRIVVSGCGDVERRRLASSGTSTDESPTYRRTTTDRNSRTESLSSSSSSDAARGATKTRDAKSKTLPGIKEVSGENAHRQQNHHHHVVDASMCLPVFCLPFRPHARDAKQQKSTKSTTTSSEAQASEVSEEGKSTIAMGILMTSGFVWMPMCQPHRARTDSDLADSLIHAAANCPRWHVRRNALCDHMKILLPQATRESVEKEFAERKTSMTRKVSQYFKAMYCTEYDVDLI